MTLVGSIAPLPIEQNKTSSTPAAQVKPASTSYGTNKSDVSAAACLSNALLPTATLQAAHDAVFSGSVVDGLLGDGKAASNAGLVTVGLDLGQSIIPKTSLAQPCGSCKARRNRPGLLEAAGFVRISLG